MNLAFFEGAEGAVGAEDGGGRKVEELQLLGDAGLEDGELHGALEQFLDAGLFGEGGSDQELDQPLGLLLRSEFLVKKELAVAVEGSSYN